MNLNKIITTDTGTQILDFLRLTDNDSIPEQFRKLNYSQILAKYQGQYVIIYNNRRHQWEFPGGGIEKGESLQDCAIREAFEESGQRIIDPKLAAIAKSYFPKQNITLAGAIFTVDLTEVVPFAATEEIGQIKLWDPVSEDDCMDEYGRTILDLVLGEKVNVQK